jgi:hypothetical protein
MHGAATGDPELSMIGSGSDLVRSSSDLAKGPRLRLGLGGSEWVGTTRKWILTEKGAKYSPG